MIRILRCSFVPVALALVAWPLPASPLSISNLVSAEAAPGGVPRWRLSTDSGALVEVSLLRPNLLRIEAGQNGVLTPAGDGKAPIVLDLPPATFPHSWQEDAESYRLETAALALVIDKRPLRFSLYGADHKTLLWRELQPLELGGGGSLQLLSRRDDESFFGGGQQNGAFEFAGRKLEISYSGGWEEGDRPNPAPFFMSSRGWGILRNSWKEGVYDFREAGEIAASHAEDRFDAYYFTGSNIAEVLAAYTELTGRARLLPRWAYEYGDADCYNDGDNVKKPGTVPAGWRDGPTGTTPDVIESVAKKYREHHMPGGWILPNDGYGCGYTDLPAVVEGLARYGFKTGLWTENGVEKIAWEVGQAGSRAQKLDVAWTGEGYQHAMDANAAAYEGLFSNSDARPFLWTVMGWAGIQRYAVTWTGDQSGSFDYIRWHIPTLIGSGLSGQVYATGDVDGIFGGSPETYTRDLQWKSFTPVLMGMSGWSQAVRKHPWAFAEPHLSIHRRFLLLRQRLMPYLYTLAHEAEETGAPLVRGLMWDHPQDPAAFTENYKDQFFLGRDLLVAPVYRSQAASGGWRRGVYLPKGTWVHYWDGREAVAGAEGRQLDVAVGLDTIPVFVRAGAILPLYPPSLYDGEVPKGELTLELYPHGHSRYTLYEDDGLSREYREGRFSQQTFEMIRQENGEAASDIEIRVGAVSGEYRGQETERALRLRVLTRFAPASVLLDGSELPRLAERAAFEAAAEGYFYDPADRFGTLEVRMAKTSIRRAVRFEVRAPAGERRAQTADFPAAPAEGRRVPADSLLVIGRPAEESGHPVENAFDDRGETWFRTTRNQAIKTGPHELTLSLGERRLIDGIEIAPRTDQHWKYGQPRDIEIYLGDNNGDWGEPAFRGRLKHQQEMQTLSFPPRAGRLLRLRVLTTHDPEGEEAAGADPLVAAAAGASRATYNAQTPAALAPITLSSLHLLERRSPSGPQRQVYLADLAPLPAGLQKPEGVTRVLGRSFSQSLLAQGPAAELELQGNWQGFRATVGLADGCAVGKPAHFEVWGDGRRIWSSGPVAPGEHRELELDLRGLGRLELRTANPDSCAFWSRAQLLGFAGDVAAWR